MVSSRTRGVFKFVGTVVAMLTLMIGSAYTVRNWRDRVVQPIQFNHRKHAAQMECSACHTYYTLGAHSGLPDESTCSICHATALTKSPEEAKLLKMLAEGKPVVFKKLFHLPEHVYYSHRRHAVLGKLECTQCHDGIANTEVPPAQPLVKITMNFCLDCHQKSKVTTDCKSCHR
jgi:hypothetical protein